MTNDYRDVVGELRGMQRVRTIRDRYCESKSNENPRYLALSNAVVGLNKAIADIGKRAGDPVRFVTALSRTRPGDAMGGGSPSAGVSGGCTLRRGHCQAASHRRLGLPKPRDQAIECHPLASAGHPAVVPERTRQVLAKPPGDTWRPPGRTGP